VKEVVECHSGYDYPDRPAALHWEGERLNVIHITARWRTPEGHYFRVTTEAGSFELFFSEREEHWQVQPA
jgi:hypothetical protein